MTSGIQRFFLNVNLLLLHQSTWSRFALSMSRDQTSGSHDFSHLVQTVIFFFDVPILLLIFSYLQDT